jgi:hypothetical protein
MKKNLLLVLIAVLSFGCSIKNNKENESDESDSQTMGSPDASALDKLMIGSYVGAFGDNKIRVMITKMDQGLIEGRSIVAGNDRPFSGSYKFMDNEIVAEAEEPGDDRYDGMFVFRFSADDRNVLSGDWTPYNKGKSSKNFELERRNFIYRKNVGYYPQASTRYLNESDVENMSKDELKIMRNEIFARHGYCFKKKDLREAFEVFDWYVPATASIVDDLTDIEKKNIQLIKRYEQYATEYGDVYGR